MMIAHPQMDSLIDLSIEKVNTLVIENPAFFRELLQDMNAQIQGYTGKRVLSRDNEPVDFSRNAEIIDSFLSFEINRKPLITKLIARMEAAAVSESYYLRTAKLMGELEQYVLELSFDLPCNVFCSKMSIGGVLRSAGLEISSDYDNDLERLLDYMELTRELDREKLFIIVNLRSYFTDAEVSAFLSTVISHEYQVLLVDSASREKLPNELRVTVDNDLCEF